MFINVFKRNFTFYSISWFLKIPLFEKVVIKTPIADEIGNFQGNGKYLFGMLGKVFDANHSQI